MDLIVVLDTNAYSDWRRSSRWHADIGIADRESLLLEVGVGDEAWYGRMRQRAERSGRFTEDQKGPPVRTGGPADFRRSIH